MAFQFSMDVCFILTFVPHLSKHEACLQMQTRQHPSLSLAKLAVAVPFCFPGEPQKSAWTVCLTLTTLH